jgi:hypothetical protein
MKTGTIASNLLDLIQGIAALAIAHISAYALVWVSLYSATIAIYATQGTPSAAVGGFWLLLWQNIAIVQFFYGIPLSLWLSQTRPSRGYGVIIGAIVTILLQVNLQGFVAQGIRFQAQP